MASVTNASLSRICFLIRAMAFGISDHRIGAILSGSIADSNEGIRKP